MTLQEALNSKKVFRRKGSVKRYYPKYQDLDQSYFVLEDILATDWIVEPDFEIRSGEMLIPGRHTLEYLENFKNHMEKRMSQQLKKESKK